VGAEEAHGLELSGPADYAGGVDRFVSPSPKAAPLAAAFDALDLRDLPDDLCLVLGGDGTMLRAVRQYGSTRAYLGVNCGNMGFLMNDVAGEPEVVARLVTDALRAGAWTRSAFPRLRATAELATGAEVEDVAVNDVYVERTSGQTCWLRIHVDGDAAVDPLVADGLIVATPLGSTAYSFSAGGPAAHPRARATLLTAIAPHRPRLAPVVLPPGARVDVEVLDPTERPARVVVDGRQHGDVRHVRVRPADDDVTLGYLAGHDFTETMVRKILRV